MDESTTVLGESDVIRCCTCGLPITAREIPRLEGEPCCQRCLAGFALAVRQALESPTLSSSLIPWLRREELGVVRAFVQTVGDGLSHPTRFFARLPTVSRPWAPLLFAVVCTLVFYFPGLFINRTFVLPTVLQALNQALESQQIPGWFKPILDWLAVELTFTDWMMLMVQFIIMQVVFASWIQQVFVYLAGSRRGYEVTLQVRCYSLVGMSFLLIPLVGYIISLIYWIAINALGLREVHGIPGWASVLAAISPLLVFSVIALGAGAGAA